ncbi:MAG: AAA family ATPase [Chloroflexi bacterium]|nr:AAA family ATPase [Chloroflexota bacterium]
MDKHIKPSRVRASINALYSWSQTVKTQYSQHLFPFLALIEKGVNSSSFSQFEEADDFVFWDRYTRLPGDPRAPKEAQDWTDNYYVDPLTRVTRSADHPHRSPSTFRKRTFANSWRASEYKIENGKTLWKLSPKFSEIFERKVLSKAGFSTRVPVVDLAIFLFHGQTFPDNADAHTLEQRFRKQFPLDDADYERLFAFHNEESDNIFSPEDPKPSVYREEIEQALRPLTYETQEQLRPTTQSQPGQCLLDDDHPLLLEVMEIIALGSSGIILRGCPGTGKTWYAAQIARALTKGKAEYIYRVQFHPSYGYEDFIEGYKPAEDSKSGFMVVEKTFLEACKTAADAASSASTVVFIIDEINRGDPARIFGELLTYLEHDYRGVEFSLPYSRGRASIPSNLIVLGTMNHHDKSIAQLDQAFLRRFDHIDLQPDGSMVGKFLEASTQFTQTQIDLIVTWFESIQRIVETGVGHTYFKDVRKLEHLAAIWRYRIHPYCASILELEPEALANLEKMFQSLYERVSAQASESHVNENADTT